VEARLVPDPQQFLDAAGPLLLADEARHNVVLGLARTLVEQPGHYPEHRLHLVEDGGAVVGAALRTPPYYLAVARPAAGGALDALAEAIDEPLPGVTGAVPEVDRFAAAWSARTGAVPHVTVRMGLYRLERVVPASAPGAVRAATEADLELLVAWWSAFLAEVSHDPPTDVEAAVRLRLEAPGWGIGLWEDGGEPVSLAAFGNPTPNGARVGPVYTPPEARGRGYAGALVAHVSQQLLDAGRRFCFLYADQANPTANGIYRRIGYEQLCESANVAFA
jgi:predicted GNAT family acetyltransferase